MTSSPQAAPPIPRQPIGATFAVSIGILGFVLILQFAAVAIYFLPLLRDKIVESRTVASVPPAAENPVAPALQGPAAAPEREQTDPAVVQRITQLVADSDKFYRVGEFEKALTGINQAADLLADDPGILLRRARLYETLQQPADAASDYARVAALPGLTPELRATAERKLTQLGGTISGTPSTPSATAIEDVPRSGADIRENSGLQPGASLGIVDTRLRDGSAGTKVLRVAIKARPGANIDTTQMKIHVFFYEKDENADIQLTESKVVSQWISPPVNWADNEPELLDVTYIMPDSALPGSATSNGSPGRTFAGYIVGIYYNSELQDTRADPGHLAKKFPLPLYLPQN